MYWLFCPGLEQKFVEARVVVGSCGGKRGAGKWITCTVEQMSQKRYSIKTAAGNDICLQNDRFQMFA
jgi:hypothetical protein